MNSFTSSDAKPDPSANPHSDRASGAPGAESRGPQEILQGIEQKVRESLLKIEDWSAEPHRFLSEERPKSLLASLAIGGFITGMMLRRDMKARQTQSAGEAESLRPLLSLIAGAVSGFAFGAQILNEAKRNGTSLTVMGKPTEPNGAPTQSAPTPTPKLGTLRTS